MLCRRSFGGSSDSSLDVCRLLTSIPWIDMSLKGSTWIPKMGTFPTAVVTLIRLLKYWCIDAIWSQPKFHKKKNPQQISGVKTISRKILPVRPSRDSGGILENSIASGNFGRDKHPQKKWLLLIFLAPQVFSHLAKQTNKQFPGIP